MRLRGTARYVTVLRGGIVRTRLKFYRTRSKFSGTNWRGRDFCAGWIGQLGDGDKLYNKIDEAPRHCTVCYDPAGRMRGRDSQDEVKVLRDKLERLGFLCWFDIGQLGAGDQLYNKIDEALQGILWGLGRERDGQDKVKVLLDKLDRSGFLCWMDRTTRGWGSAL